MKYNSIFSDPEALAEFESYVTPPPAPKKETGWEATKRIAGDIAPSFGSGAGQLVRSVGTFFGGSDSGMSQLGQDAVDYWDKEKSAKLKAAEQDLSADMANPDVSAWSVAKKLATSPTLLTNAIASSMPSMAVGMGAGGLVARSMAGAGVMVDAAGGLTRTGSAIASGLGEGSVMAADVYENTNGKGVSSAAALALGVVTSLVTPGNIGAAAARRITGTADDAVKTIFNAGAGRRVLGAMAAEGGQEYSQEFGQKLIEQDGLDQAFNFDAANKAGVVGAVVGAAMGGGLHPVVGEGAPHYASQEEKDTAVQAAKDATEIRQAAEVAKIKLGNINTALEADPTNPVLMAEASLAQATINRANPEAFNSAESIAVQTAAAARLEAARNPGSQEADENASHATAAAMEIVAGPGEVNNAINEAVQAGAEVIHTAPDIDSAVAGFAATNDASSMRTVTTGIERAHEGVAQAASEQTADDIEAAHTYNEELAAADVARREQEQKAAREQRKAAQAEEKHRLQVERQALENQRLQDEIARAQQNEITIEAPVEQVEHPGTEGVAVGEQRKTREQIFAMYEPAIRAEEIKVNDPDLTPEQQQAALTRMQSLESERNRMAQGAPERMLTGDQVREFMFQPSVDEERKLKQEKSDTQIKAAVNNLALSPNLRALAYEEAAARGVDTGLSQAQFDAREAELARRVEDSVPDTPSRDPRVLLINLASLETGNIARVAASRNGMDATSALARVALAFRTGTHLGNVDSAIAEHTGRSTATAVESAPEGRYTLQMSPDRQTVDVVDESGETFDTYRGAAAVQDATATMNRLNSRSSSAPTPRTRAQSLAEEMRQAASEVEHEGEPETRTVNQNFSSRAQAALRDGVLDKLGRFWKNLMRAEGQRTLPAIDMSDFQRTARSAIGRGESIPEHVLTAMKDRYNIALKAAAESWAEAHGQVFDEALWVDPIISLTPYSTGRSAGFSMEMHGLGRSGANPYTVRRTDQVASIYADSSIHATRLEDAAGSADLGYRIAAEVANLRGRGFPSDGILSTVNNLRRQLQSMSSDTLFAPGTINPLTGSGNQGPQGVPSSVWNAATDIQKIGLNALRSAHSITENRGGGSTRTLGEVLENLAFNSSGEIVAKTEPKHARGFPKGTVVSEEMLRAKLAENDTQLGVPAYAMVSGGTGGIGLDTAKLGILNNTILNKIEGRRDAEIPAWVRTVAGRVGREMGGWMFSQGEESSGQAITRDEATARVNAVVGEGAAKVLLESGMISFVDTAAELTGETFSDAGGKVRGATAPDGSIVLVLENLTADNFDAVLQHEALHSTLKALVGEETYTKLMNRLDTLLKAGGDADWVQNANAAVPANTDPAHRLEEIAGYAIEQAGKGGNPLTQWAKDFMSSLRAAIIKSKRVPEALRLWAIKNLQAEDLRKLAVAGLRSQSIGAQSGTKLSTGRDYQGEVDSLMAEHAMPETTNERRSEINTEIGKLRTAQRVERDGKFERDARLSVEQEVAASTAPVQEPTPQELNVVGLNWRTGFERAAEMIRSSIQDKHVTLRRILQVAGVTAERIKIDTIGALDRLGSKLMEAQHELVKAPLAKIEHILTTAGFSAEEGRKMLDQYLIDKHVTEYNAHIATINPARYEMRNGERIYVGGYDTEHPGSGITDAEAAARIRAIEHAAENGGRERAILEANAVYRKMIADLQAYAVKQGLEKQSTIDTWNEKFPNYTPFNRDLDLDENLSIGTVPGSQGFSLRTGIARRAMGSSADIVSPLASTMLFGLKTTTRGENAVVSRTILNFAREFTPNYLSSEKGADGKRLLKPMWSVEKVPDTRVVKKVNVYKTLTADGEMSPEFYNREQARDYADYQQTIWEQMNPDADPQSSGIRVQQIGDGPQNRVVVQPVPNPMAKANVMVIPENGDNVIITFDEHSEDAMAILHGLKGTATSGENAKTMARWLTVPRMFSRWVMATSTGFNPVFALFNAARDVPGAMLSIGSDKIPGWTAADSAAIAKDFFAAAGSIWKQKGLEFRALHSNTGSAPAPAAGSMAAWAEEMSKYGGATGVRESVSEIDEAETQIRRLFGQELIEKTTSPNKANDWLSKSGGFVVKMGDAFARFGEGETKVAGIGWISRNIVSASGRLNEAAELATRTVVFKAATEKFMAAGHSEVEAKTMAANISKNVSTNFNRRGTASSVINQLFPFFNAAMQGSARLAESLFEKETYKREADGRVFVDQKTKLTAYGKVVIGSLVSLGGLQAALLAMAGFDDDDIQKSVKDRAFIVPVGTGGNYIAIPMPHGFNTIMNFGREMMDAIIHHDKAASHIGNALWQAPAFNPLGSAGNTVTDFMPAIADLPVSLYMNQDAFGRPIAKEDGDKANPTPGFTRAKEGASKTGRLLAEAINTVSGGNEDQKGALSPTPDQIDYALGFVGGGVGREVTKAASLAGASADIIAGNEREPIPTYKLPLIGRLYGDTKEPVALRSKVFNIRNDLNENYARYKGLRERGEVDAANAYWDEHPELAMRSEFERFSKNDSAQKKARALARNSDEVSEVNRINNEQDAKIADLLERYKEVKAR